MRKPEVDLETQLAEAANRVKQLEAADQEIQARQRAVALGSAPMRKSCGGDAEVMVHAPDWPEAPCRRMRTTSG